MEGSGRLTVRPLHRGGEVVSMWKQPRATDIFSNALRRRIRNVIQTPLKGASFDPSLQLMKNVLTGHKTYMHIGFHTGKGDDYESVAAIVKNPSLPIDCAGIGHFAVGVNSKTPASSIDTKTRAMLKYGGHFYTVNLEPDLLTAAEKKKGKGETYIQLDYVIVDPGTDVPGGPLVRQPTVTIIEFKTGPDLRFMDPSEEEQMLKGGMVFNRLAQKLRGQPDGLTNYKAPANNYYKMRYFYSPYLATNAALWKPSWSSKEISYLTITGLGKILRVSVTDLRNLGSLRSDYVNYYDKKCSAIYDEVSNNIGEDAAEYFARVLPKSSTQLGVVWNAPENASVLGNKNWKKNQQKIARLATLRKVLMNNFAKNAKEETFKKIVQVTKAIINSDTSNVLNESSKQGLRNFLNNLNETQKAYMNEEFIDDTFENWVETRRKFLKTDDLEFPRNLTDSVNVILVRNVQTEELRKITNAVVESKTGSNLSKSTANLRKIEAEIKKLPNLNATKQNKLNAVQAIRNAINQQYNLFEERRKSGVSGNASSGRSVRNRRAPNK
jgi:hypothetical protein